jgi:hypothetical protein
MEVEATTPNQITVANAGWLLVVPHSRVTSSARRG